MEILLKSLLIGALVGFPVGMGAARMFHIPETQGMGAFRTLGELNACQGDPISHFSYGLGFLFSAMASSVAAGALSTEVDHRIIPNWSASVLLFKNKNVAETLHDPKKMAYVGSVIGMLLVAFLNVTANSVPASLQNVATQVIMPAADWLLNPVMPIVFWMAALNAGKETGKYGTIFGGFAQMVMGNAVPGLVLGILIGKGVEEAGWTKTVKIMFTATTILFVFSAFFRGVDVTLLESMRINIPKWLINLHGLFGMEV